MPSKLHESEEAAWLEGKTVQQEAPLGEGPDEESNKDARREAD